MSDIEGKDRENFMPSRYFMFMHESKDILMATRSQLIIRHLRKASIGRLESGACFAMMLGGLLLFQASAAPVPGTVLNLNGSSTGMTNIVAISSGFDSNVILDSNGRVHSFGNRFIVANQPADLSNVVSVSAGSGFALALKDDGTVVGWGARGQSGLGIPSDLLSVAAISAGFNTAIALKHDGTVVAWGGGGANTPPNGLMDVVSVSCGLEFNLALKSDGSVIGWGHGSIRGETVPSDLGQIVAISASIYTYQYAAIRKNGTVVGWGSNYNGLTIIPGISNAIAVAAQNGGGVVLKSDGSVTGWNVSLFGKIYNVTYSPLLNGISAISANQALKTVFAPSIPIFVSVKGNLSFGNHKLNSKTKKTITIRNTGNSALRVTRLKLPSGFSGKYSGTIQPGKTKKVSITFKPTKKKTYKGTLKVYCNATLGKTTLSLKGKGI